MKSKTLRLLAICLFVLTTSALLRADRDADRRKERIPFGHKMRSPLHKAVKPSASSSSPTGFTPQQMRHAYGFDQLNTTGQGQVIAIVDAYGSPTIQADLDTFCAAFGLPSTTVGVYFPQGQPAADSGWATETSLDVEWAHAIAPGAKIVLVAAQSANTTDLFAAVDYAVSLGATQVSMSWTATEYPSEGTSDYHFNVPNVTFFASSGDFGSYISKTNHSVSVNYPACSPYVVSVGGTTLALDPSNNISSETAWSYNAGTGLGSGGGVSVYESAPSYQSGWWSGTKRGVPDVAYDADPNTGVPVYMTGAGWAQYGGTSMSAPQWAALSALANSLRSQSISSAPSFLYSLATANYAGYYHDIISGNNGAYSAGPNYDLVTGLGSPAANQLVIALAGGFSSQVVAPVFFPGAGAYASGNVQNVAIVSATPGASIRYTTDGSMPTETSGTPYAGPVPISMATTLKAIAYESGLTDSPVTSGSYTFLPQAAAPTLSPPAGTYTTVPTITISTTTSGANIRYTIDGSTPSESHGTLYAGPVSLSHTVQLQAIAYESGFIDSPVASGTYTINTPTPLSVVYNFPGATGGVAPVAGLVLASDGNFYGTTQVGGSSNNGTVFKMTPAGVLTTLVAFSGANGANPYAALIQGSDGNFYGTTYFGGSSNNGTVFKMTPAGVLTTLVSFSGANGQNPVPALVQGSDGNFYGTTEYGGGSNDGTVFKMTPTGILTTLVTFNGLNGATVYAGLVQGSDGNFYGATSDGGGSSDGTIFRMTPAGILTTVVTFNGANGQYPDAALVQGSDGNFYGTTYYANGSNSGTIFRMTPTGTLTVLHTFNYTDGFQPEAPLVQGGDGNFYGATIDGGFYNYGTIFRITPAGVFTSLVSFDSSHGAYPFGNLVQGGDGNFYGTTETGGTSNEGVVFRLTQAATPAFSPIAGVYASAQSVTITTATSGATIRYTTDGSTPSETNGLIYSTPVSISTNTKLAAIAYGTGFIDSGVASGFYSIGPPTPQVAAPTFSPPAGNYTSAQTVTISTSTSGASIRYTTDGSTPGETNGVPYSTPVSISASTTLKAIAYETGLIDSPVTTGIYMINLPPAAAPVYSPAAGTYSSAQNVTISTTTSGASIRYTIDGSTPTETVGTLYTGVPVGIGTSGVLNAIAYAAGFADSPVTSGIYTIILPTVPSLNVLYNFTGSTDGDAPQSGLVQGTDGNFYGTAANGGSANDGTVFKMTPAGILTPLASFSGANGANPYAGLVQGSDGNFYGTTQSGGSSNVGTVFRMTPAGVLTSLVSFNSANGSFPYANLVQYSDGNFYGTTVNGGSFSAGTVFKITPAGVLTTLVSFNTTNGKAPTASLARGSDGNFYGTTEAGGSSDGTVFKMTPAGALTTLVSFNGTNGNIPYAGLVQGGDGNFYGTAQIGGSGNIGTVYKMTPAGVLISLVSFTGANGSNPTGNLVQGSDGNFYGTTYFGGSSNDGTVFKITPAGTLTTLVSFTGANGKNPDTGLVQGSDGNYYGTTRYGGASNDGTVFQIIMPHAAAPTFSPLAGTYNTAQSVTISSATSGVSIAYTTDGTNPTESGGIVTHGTLLSNGGSISISATTTLKAMAFESGFVDSTVASGTYMIVPQAAAPTFSPVAGTYTGAQSVTVSSITSGATIVYTTDGTTPTESGGTVTNGTLLSNGGSVTVSATTTIKAIAFKGGLADSPVAVAAYSIINFPPAVAPTFNPVAGTYTGTQSVTITSTTSGASIAYTTDGSTPAEAGGSVTNGTLLSNGGSVSISTNTTINAMAFASNYTDSAVATATYVINIPQAAAPTFNPPGGSYTGTQSVTIASATSGASIAYTTDGSTPTEAGGSVTNGTLLSNGGSVSISANATLNAIALASGYTDSAVATAAYSITAPIPTAPRIQGSNGNRPPINLK
jgi:uncharacterized repeat protein (TIGR03803 family)